MKKRFSFIEKKFFLMLGGGTINCMLASLLVIIDAVIAGIFVGENAVAGVNLITPVYSLAAFLGMIISEGIPILYLRAIGNFDKKEADNRFGMGLFSTILSGIVMFVLLFTLGDAYIEGYHASAEVNAEAARYLFWMQFVILLFPPVILINEMQCLFLEKDLKNPGRCMFNIPMRFDIYVNADMEKIAAAICTAVKAHPALLSRIEKRDGVYYLCHNDKDFSVSVEQMSDDELEKEAALFVRPFEISSEPLFRCRLIRGKSKGMLLLDVYHVICDGYSLQKLVADIKAAFIGEAIPKDYCYALLKDEAKYQASSGYKKDMDYFADIYDMPNQDTFPRPDKETKENTADSVFLPFDFNRYGVYNLEKAYGFGRGGLYAAAAMIAIAAYNDSEDIMLTWTFHGRTDSRRMNSVGLFICDIPLALHLKRGLVLSKLYEDISSQIHNGISHGNVSYWVEKRHYEGNDLACILYQKDIYELSESALGFSNMKELSSNVRACNNDTVDIGILDGKEEFGVLLDYNAKRYYPESMERFGNILGTICKQMISLNPNTTTVGQIIQTALGSL